MSRSQSLNSETTIEYVVQQSGEVISGMCLVAMETKSLVYVNKMILIN